MEWCNQTSSVKYLFKYVNKGPDRVAVVVEPLNKTQTTQNEQTSTREASNSNEKAKNEIKDFFDCR